MINFFKEKTFTLGPILLFSIIIFSNFMNTNIGYGQDLSIYTKNNPGPIPELVYLSWPYDSVNTDMRYNIYRKLPTDANYPETPLNHTPIGSYTDCNIFKTIIPFNSEDWKVISKALSDSTGLFSNVCDLTSLPKNSGKWKIAVFLSQFKPNLAIVMGNGYMDYVQNGLHYKYQIKRVTPDGSELPSLGSNENSIVSGSPAAIPRANIRGVADDEAIQIVWDKILFPSFNVYRSTNGATFEKINNFLISTISDTDFVGNGLNPPCNTFTDFSKWDSLGNPIPRDTVSSKPIFGPKNGTRYYYKVKIKDILGNEGPFSNDINITPIDKTSPGTPQIVNVVPDESVSGFTISWQKTIMDVKGRKEENNVAYKVFRYEKDSIPSYGATLVPGSNVVTGSIITITDNSPGLRNSCREKTYYYRVEAADQSGNVSSRSIAMGAALKDITKPQSPTGTRADGFEDSIVVWWNIATNDCDTGMYLIYRSLCDFGRPDTNTTFSLVGQLSYTEAKSRAIGNNTYFGDHTIPAGSPICYAYVVKAQDLAQNISGSFPRPDNTEVVVCQRLRDRTPPEPAIISGLFALDSAIQVDFIGAPIQDIAAYHIYRSDNETGPYVWQGGMLIKIPPGPNLPLTVVYDPPPQIGCDVIPLVSNDYMSAGTFIDRNVEQKKIYWYKVLGVDKNGNESNSIDSAVAVSTFTFATKRDAAPKITSIDIVGNPCSFKLNMTPTYDPNTMLGYVIFRSDNPFNNVGPYNQIDNIVKGGSYTDNSIAKNKGYWYKVAILNKDGSLTQLSEPKSVVHP